MSKQAENVVEEGSDDSCKTWSVGADKTVGALVCLVPVAADGQYEKLACSVMRTTAWKFSHPDVTLYSQNHCHRDTPQERMTLARAYNMPQEPGKELFLGTPLGRPDRG